ncbi:MAG TPA: hypothetical protein VMJ32_12895 [Pirellulales bacterium]|nr:hypothetical protein [Pirellulales bacterium]
MQYKSNDEATQNALIELASNADDPAAIGHELNVARALLNQCLAEGRTGRPDAIALLSVLTRMAKEFDRQALRAQYLLPIPAVERLFREVEECLVLQFQDVPGWQERSLKAYHLFQQRLAEGISNPAEMKQAKRLCDLRNNGGSK